MSSPSPHFLATPLQAYTVDYSFDLKNKVHILKSPTLKLSYTQGHLEMISRSPVID